MLDQRKALGLFELDPKGLGQKVGRSLLLQRKSLNNVPIINIFMYFTRLIFI